MYGLGPAIAANQAARASAASAAAAVETGIQYNRNCMWCTPGSVGASQCHCNVPCGSSACASKDSLALHNEMADRVFSALVKIPPVPRFR